jgi:tetratricopeptide (TPR) repeat protein
MADTPHLLLLNDALKDHILRLREPDRRRLREKLGFLAHGIWDAGVRVKKLHGSGKVVFEARMNRGDRLLFTLGRGRRGLAIYLWALVAHDDIDSGARRIQPANAPFLSFQELEPEDREDLLLEDVPAPWLTQEDVGDRTPEDSGPQRWLVLDDEEWERMLASPDPASFESFLYLTREQEQLLASPPPVLISGTAGSGKTTLSVYYLIRGAGAGRGSLFITYNPLLERLARRIYMGLMEKRVTAPGAAHPRFAVFRDLIREISGTAGFPPEKEVGLVEFTALFHDHRDRRRYDAELVWEEIRSVIKGAKLPLDPGRAAALVARFRADAASAAERRELAEYIAALDTLALGREASVLLRARTPFAGLHELAGAAHAGQPEQLGAAADALSRISDLVSRHAADFTRPLLTLEEYQAVGAKRAPAFRHDRAAIHGIAQYYQQRLEREGRWDEIDLTRAALQRLDGSPRQPTWDLVVCDEVQDLTDVQISLVFRLARDPRGVVLAGDPRQILNPSGFRWEEVKYRFRERGLPVPEVKRLALNFRSAGSVVRLANELLDIKQALVGLTDTELREEWKFGGRPPALLAGVAEADVLAGISGTSAGQAVLTRTPREAARLRERLGTEMVFTIAEAKGLEFDTVLLWRYCEDPGSEDIWRSIASGQAPAEERIPHVRHELALLYVAVTRARNTLLVWDGESPSPLWSIPGIASLVYRMQESAGLAGLWRAVSTPEEWEAQGDYFLDREQYRAARECYRNAGAEAKAELAAAFGLEREGRWSDAAPLFERHGMAARAAACAQKAADWPAAFRLWEAAGDKRRARHAEAMVAGADGRHERAAGLWESLGENGRAAESWRLAGAHEKLAEAALAAGDPRGAAALFEKAKKPREAAAAWEKAGGFEKAGDLYLRVGDHASAARMFQKSGSAEKLLRCLRQLGDHRRLGLALEAQGETEKAIASFGAFAAQSAENRSVLENEVPEARTRRSALKAAIRLAALGRDAEAAALFEQAGSFDAAAERHARLRDGRGLSRCLEASGRYREAAAALAGAGLDPVAAADEMMRLLYAHLDAAGGKAEREAESLHAEALRLLQSGTPADAAAALARFRLLEDEESAAEAYKALGRHAEAITYLVGERSLALARRYAAENAVVLPWESLESLCAEHSREGNDPELFSGLRSLILSLIPAAARALTAAELAGRVEGLLDLLFGSFVGLDEVPVGVLRLAADAPALRFLARGAAHSESAFVREPGLKGTLLSLLADAVGRSGDECLAALAAFFAGRPDEFERLAAGLPLTPGTAHTLVLSRGRYRQAAEHLMSAGDEWEALYHCRRHKDHALAAALCEAWGEHEEAMKYHRTARDFSGALRAAHSTGDERNVARALEWAGRLEEAEALWRKLGRDKDAVRLSKKRGAGSKEES